MTPNPNPNLARSDRAECRRPGPLTTCLYWRSGHKCPPDAQQRPTERQQTGTACRFAFRTNQGVGWRQGLGTRAVVVRQGNHIPADIPENRYASLTAAPRTGKNKDVDPPWSHDGLELTHSFAGNRHRGRHAVLWCTGVVPPGEIRFGVL